MSEQEREGGREQKREHGKKRERKQSSTRSFSRFSSVQKATRILCCEYFFVIWIVMREVSGLVCGCVFVARQHCMCFFCLSVSVG